MKAIWTKGFPNSEKKVKPLYEEGVGYYRLDGWTPGLYAQRIVLSDEPLPLHLEECSAEEVKQLEKIRGSRQGMRPVRR